MSDELQNNQAEADNTLQLSDQTINHLDETRKWTTFLSILGFVFLGLLIIFGLFFGRIFSRFGNMQMIPFAGLIGIIYIIMAIIYFFPIYYLYMFSSYAKKACETRNPTDMEKAMQNLKSHFKFIGILIIVVLSLYLLIFLIALSTGALFR